MSRLPSNMSAEVVLGAGGRSGIGLDLARAVARAGGHWQIAVPLLLLSLAVAQPAAARPCGQVVPCAPITLEGPIPNPLPGDPAAVEDNPVADNVQVAKIPQSYVQEEFFFAGNASVFDYDQQPGERGAFPGQRLVAVQTNVPYKTRMIVLRPTEAKRFNGTVVVEFMNSTGGRDNAVMWTVSAFPFAREGAVYIGVTTSGNQSMAYLLGGCGGPSAPCGTRYSSNGLVISNNGQEYEIISQLVTALKSRDTNQIPLPRNFPRIKRVFVTGESQQGGSALTYTTQFHFPAVDGHLVLSASSARALRSGLPTCGTTGAPAYPGCVAVPTDQRIRTDLPVPVYQLLAETDVQSAAQIATRQNDTDISRFASYRLVEIAGGAHNTDSSQPVPGTSFTLADFCVNPSNTLVSGPIFGKDVINAFWQNMELQVDFGVRPPSVTRIAKDAAGVTLRDALGNPLGGARLPEMDVPTNVYFAPFNMGKPVCTAGQDPGSPPVCIPQPFALIGLACALSGSYRPLTPAIIAELYPTHGTYVRKIADKSLERFAQRTLLWDDAVEHIRDAAASDVGK